jgi:cyclophilin family peptidyl-prolyl cis-trans isomerase
LESVCRVTPTVGSNPTLSANSFHFVSVVGGSGGRSCVKAAALRAWPSTPNPTLSVAGFGGSCFYNPGLSCCLVRLTGYHPGVHIVGHRSILCVFLLLGFVIGVAGCDTSPRNPKVPAGAKSSGGMHATIETDKGSIELELLPDAAPRAVENFRLLAEHGYYDGLTFHRLVKGFMIQGGDPNGNGTGGESAWGGLFADEINPNSDLYNAGYRRGIVAMANSGPNTNGSQFFIMQADYPLPPAYVIFARVIGGMTTVDAIASLPTTPGPRGEMSKPIVPPIIKKITIRP